MGTDDGGLRFEIPLKPLEFDRDSLLLHHISSDLDVAWTNRRSLTSSMRLAETADFIIPHCAFVLAPRRSIRYPSRSCMDKHACLTEPRRGSNLLRHPAQQRLGFSLLSIRFRIRQKRVRAILDFADSPGLRCFRSLEEGLILFK